MFGVPEPASKRYGKLSQYFEHVVHGITHLLFVDNIPQQPFWEKFLRESLGNHGSLPAAELERLWGKFFTQYYPHEHADFPPYVLYGEHRPNHRLYRIGSRAISNYLEEYIDTLAEEMSKIEEAWKKERNLVKEHPARHDILARLGNVLHCVEDYFFHSNYLELHLWNELRRGRPSTETEEQFRQWFAANVSSHWLPEKPSLDPTPDDRWKPSKTHQVRSHMRRLRYPLYKPVNTLDREASESAVQFLFTAGFDKKDLFHTMAGALEGLESAFNRFDKKWQMIPEFLQKKFAKQNPGLIRETELVLIKMLFSKDERTRMGRDPKYLADRMAVHAKQLEAGLYEDSIDSIHASGHINNEIRDAWKAAIALDREMEKFGSQTQGIGGFLMQFFAQAQRELNKSRLLSQGFDAARKFGEGNIFDVRSDNGATGEHIGTHTLMSKDTPRSLPVYEECRVVSKFASMAVATLMATEVNDNGNTSVGLDWARILRHYMRYPAAKPSMWESQVLAHVRKNNADPTYDEIPDKVAQPRAQGADASMLLMQRRNGTARQKLEERYIALEERVNRFQLIPI